MKARTFIVGLLTVAVVGWASHLQAVEFVFRSSEASPSAAADSFDPVVALIEARIANGEFLEALLLIHQAIEGPGGGRSEELLTRAHLLLQERLDDAQLAEATFMFQGTPIGQDALLQQALRAAGSGEIGTARTLTERLLQGNVPFPYRQEANTLWERLAGEDRLQRAVGVLLPLSGRYANFGELVRRGMDLALELSESVGNKPVRFLYRDTAADELLSERAVEELAEGERVLAVAGPLTGTAAQAAANQAQKMRIPLVSLSQKDGVPEIGDYVFRDSLTSRQQVLALVRYAMEERQLTSFAILHPENRMGLEMADIFTREVESRGGRIASRQGYGENLTDFRRQIKLLKRENPDAPDPEPTKTNGAAAPVKPLPFEALFLPDYADRVGLIAPQLAFYGIENIPLFGINGWNSPDLILLAGRYVEGAVFVDGFYRQSQRPAVQEFVNRYFQKYGEEPTILEAQGFDAAGILLSVLAGGEIRTREEMRAALSMVRDYPGITGATTFNREGEAEKNLFLLRVLDGNIEEID